jgi:hypothetical protein
MPAQETPTSKHQPHFRAGSLEARNSIMPSMIRNATHILQQGEQQGYFGNQLYLQQCTYEMFHVEQYADLHD